MNFEIIDISSFISINKSIYVIKWAIWISITWIKFTLFESIFHFSIFTSFSIWAISFYIIFIFLTQREKNPNLMFDKGVDDFMFAFLRNSQLGTISWLFVQIYWYGNRKLNTASTFVPPLALIYSSILSFFYFWISFYYLFIYLLIDLLIDWLTGRWIFDQI